MPTPDLIELFVQPLNQLNIRYLVSGSVAAMLYGEPRLTLDIDLIVFLRSEDVLRLSNAFRAPHFYFPPKDVVLIELARERHGHFNVIHPGSGFKADFYTANRDELHEWASRHIKKYSSGAIEIALAPPEYVIIRKLEYFREGGSDKHIRDICSMLAVSGDQINRAELHEWIRRRGLELQWKKVEP